MAENETDKLLAAFAGLFLLPFILFFATIIGTVAGAIGGWAVGLFYGDTILFILNQLGVHGVTMGQFGAFLGFVGGFFKSVYMFRNPKK